MYYITFQQIEAFITTARLRNISLAAEKLSVSQPTLSKTLQRFESGLGYEVFNRSNRGITLTPQGKYLFDAFESLYANMETAIRKAKDFGAKVEKHLNINVPITYDFNRAYDLPKKMIEKYTEKYPDVIISERLYDFEDFLQQLEFGSADISFTHEFLAESIPNLEYRRITKLPMYLAMPADHPLASYDVLPFDKLDGYDYYSIRFGSQSEDMFRKICQKYGFTPRSITLLDNFQTWLHVMCEKNGISFCAKSEDMASLAMKFYPVDMEYYIVAAWRPDRISEQLDDFLNMLGGTERPE